MQIVEKLLSELTMYENNPRNNDEAVEAVANSIREFGFRVPIIIDKDGVIVTGHTRYKASKKLGLEKVPCIIADDLNEEQVRMFRLADNKVAEIALWDLSLLETELEGIEGYSMEQFGFDAVEGIELDTYSAPSNDDYEETEDDESDDKEEEKELVQCPNCGEWFEA